MTREQKLSLIMGFALVLAVGVLLTDHFSGANRGQSASPEVMGASTEIKRDSSEPPLMTITQGVQMAKAGGDAIADGIQRAAGSDDFKEWVNSAHAAIGVDEAKTPIPAAPVNVPRVPTIVMGGDDQDDANAPAPGAPGRGVTTYTVRKNDTLWGIAQEFYGDGALHTKLAAYNEGRTGKGGALYAGATLLIPPASELGGGPSRVASTPRATKAPAPKPKSEAARFYTVQKNDTLSQIAQRELGTVKRMNDIMSLNREKIDSPDDIWVGLKLKLPST